MKKSFEDARVGHLKRLFTGFKNHLPNLVFFFHKGAGFYEAYYGDALLLARHLDAPLDFYADIPISRMDRATAQIYAQRLIRDQYDVGFCEREEEPYPEAEKMLDIGMKG